MCRWMGAKESDDGKSLKLLPWSMLLYLHIRAVTVVADTGPSSETDGQ